MTIQVAEVLAPEDEAQIFQGLQAVNEAAVGPADARPLAVLARDDRGQVRGGLLGTTHWGWLYTRWLWVEEAQRGQGWGTRLLRAAEAEARTRGCHGAYIDTFHPRARALYERLGYAVFGELADFPRGRTRWFLAKRWSSAVDSES